MKQVVQNYRTGGLRVTDVPVPACRPGGVLVRSAWSLVSTGTERMKVNQARMSFLGMAKARPDKVAQAVQSIRQVGVMETINKVRERLDSLTSLGYSVSGIVEQVGRGLDEFRVGDRVACAGEGIACHAECIFVPRNLCVRVPDEVELRDAAFATVGAIALHGVRQARVQIGDSVLVIGLGLVGLLAVQILKAAGCQVYGIDMDAKKVSLATSLGADQSWTRDTPGLEENLRLATGGRGPDVVYVAASTESADPMDFAGRVVRDRGRVVVVGMVKVEADWRSYYQKELSVVMSRSYGPGRYDRNFESKGLDYPVGYVPWTQRRNLAEFLRLIAIRAVQPGRLEPAVFPIHEAASAYEELHDAPHKHSTGILFEYPEFCAPHRRVELPTSPRVLRRGLETVGVSLIGAGNFATGTLIPALKRLSFVRLRGICSAGGLSARSAGERHGFHYCTSDIDEVLRDDETQAVLIATRHDTHASFASSALRAGKHVFVEKPLALTREQLDELFGVYRESNLVLMPGFNRRFSPLSTAVRRYFENRAAPIQIVCRVNAGAIKADSWYQDTDEGGWRIISEGCHFVDLIQFLAGSRVTEVRAQMIAGTAPGEQNDDCAALLNLADGSLATLTYISCGDPGFEKERIEVFGQGVTAAIENWKSARVSIGGKVHRVRASGAGKGHGAEVAAFLEAVRGNVTVPIAFEDAVHTTQVTFAIAESMGRHAAACLVSERGND